MSEETIGFMMMTIKVLLPFAVMFQIIPLLIWLERKGSAFIQDRHGPNRAAIQGVRVGGLVHSLADVVKLLFKEEITPDHVNKPFYVLAPFLALFVACVTFLVIPYADGSGFLTSFQAADLNVGILYLLAMSSLGVYGVMLAGWSSNNKFALLGGLRSGAQMVSYELSLGVSLLAVLLISGSLSLQDIVLQQSASIFSWNFFLLPIPCLIFIVSTFAETNRAPFDLPEGESELVAGYHVEYSSMKFAMFFMAEYAHMIIASAMIVTLFFGGWQVPFVSTETLRSNAETISTLAIMIFSIASFVIGLLLVSKYQKGKYGDKRDYEVLILGVPAILTGILVGIALLLFAPIHLDKYGAFVVAAGVQILTFIGKLLFMCWVFMWVRWTLPRFRYDQLMTLGWKYLLPASMIWLAGQSVWMVL